MSKVKVLIVDDSKLIRDILTSILSHDDNIEVIGQAADPFEAAGIIKKKVPDVMTLDIEMPRMDGLTFLKKVMSQHPIPTIIISTLTEKNSDVTLRALKVGAIDFFTKSSLKVSEKPDEAALELIEKVKHVADVRVNRVLPKSVKPKFEPPTLSDGEHFDNQKVICIGSSTGGTEALAKILKEIPGDYPPIVVAQHMPRLFTKQFADRLNEESALTVVEAKDGDELKPGMCFITPGDFHAQIVKGRIGYELMINQEEKVNRHRPSVDVLFKSAKSVNVKKLIAVILTGMGKDGAEGMKELHELGVKTIAQNEESCVVYGMPRAAVELNGVSSVFHLNDIAQELIQLAKKG